MGQLLQSVALQCEAHHAPPEEEAGGEPGAASAPLLAALRGPGLVVLNYHMSTAGQTPFGGHFSPLGAYHARSRRFLVLDVWPDTEPAWLDGEALLAAMRHVDDESGQSRGWLHVERGAQP